MSTNKTHADLTIFMDQMKNQNYFHGSYFSQLIEDTAEEVALKMLARFHQSLGESLLQIRAGVKSHQGDLVWRSSHKVAGTAELLGFSKLGKSSKAITQSLKAAPEIDAHFEEIKSYLEQMEEVHAGIIKGCPNLSFYL